MEMYIAKITTVLTNDVVRTFEHEDYKKAAEMAIEYLYDRYYHIQDRFNITIYRQVTTRFTQLKDL